MHSTLSVEIGFPASLLEVADSRVAATVPFTLLAGLMAAAFPALASGQQKAWLLGQHEAVSRNVCGLGAWGLAEHYVKNGMYIFIFP